MTFIRQTSFSAGELDPKLYGRSDLPQYAVGMATIKNAFVTKQGQILSRPGTEFICTAINERDDNTGVFTPHHGCWLVPFIVSDSSSFVLEVVNRAYIGVQAALLQNGVNTGILINIDSGNTFGDSIVAVNYAQSGDVLTLCISYGSSSGSLPLAVTITRVNNTTWTVAQLDFERKDATGKLVGSDDNVFYDTATFAQAADISHPTAPWVVCYTQLLRLADGSLLETKAVTLGKKGTTVGNVAATGEWLVYPDKVQRYRINNIPAGVVQTRFYRGQGGQFGWVGDTNQNVFVDRGQAPDYTQQPPMGNNPFLLKNPATGAITDYELPKTVAYFGGRRMYGGTTKRPITLFGSAVEDYNNFDNRLYPVEDEAIQFDLAARKREEIRALIPLTKLLVFTDASVWAVEGAGGAPLAFDSVDAKVQVDIGCNLVQPRVVNNIALYARAKGKGVRAVGFSMDQGGFSGADLSAFALHLFKDLEVVDMAYCEDPFGVLWCAMSDGTMRSLTFVPEQNTFAWAQHVTDGKVISLCSVPENGEDVLYLAVRRPDARIAVGGVEDGTNVFIERMKSRRLTLKVSTTTGAITEQPWCLDSAVSLAADPFPVPADPKLGHLVGRTVTTLSEGIDVEGYQVALMSDGHAALVKGSANPLVAGAAFTDAWTRPTTNLVVGIPFTTEVKTLRPPSSNPFEQIAISRVAVEVHESYCFSAGPDETHTVEWVSRQVKDGYGPLMPRTETAMVRVSGGWGHSGAVYIKNTRPLPLTILSITRDVDSGRS